MLIAHITDLHVGFDREARPEELNVTRLRAVLERLADGPHHPDLLVISGDVTDHGDGESYDKLLRIIAQEIPHPMPILPLVGNHDSREGLRAAFPDLPGSDDGFVHYVIEAEGLRIICCDTLEDGRHGGAFCAARVRWLRRELERGAGTPAVIFMHHPPIVSGIGWMDPGAEEDWIARFASAIAGFEADICAIHCGHLHRNVVTRFRGIPLAITPSVAPLVALDLAPIEADHADGRALITTEPPSYALHRWAADQLVSHYETAGDWAVIAHYGESLKPMVAEMLAEREPG